MTAAKLRTANRVHVPMVSKARIANSADVERMLEVDRVVFRSKNNRLTRETLHFWLSKCPENVFLLEERRGAIHGRAVCLPLEFSVLDRLRRGHYALSNSELNEDLLSTEEAKRNVPPNGRGNLLYCSPLI